VAFDWMEPKRNPAHTKTLAAKRQEMIRAELAERAALLRRLGHSRAQVKARLESALRWEAERPDGTPGPAEGASDVDAILDREFGAASAPARPKR
jgi:hypothetical protein